MTELLQCEKCIELSGRIGIGMLLCETCDYKPCSICKKVDNPTQPYKELILGYDNKPICIFCKEHQCYLCGDYDGDIDWKDEGLVSYAGAGKPLCEHCGVHNWCNQCNGHDGECDYRCPKCNDVCDAECACSIECIKCGKRFEYYGHEIRNGNLCGDEAKQTCSECYHDSRQSDGTVRNDCQNCIIYRRSEVGLLKLLCDSCEYKHCSICNKLDKVTKEFNGKTYKTHFLGYNNEPVCKFCKEHQCYICGEYDDDIDWKKEGLVGYANNPACEDCWWQGWCNECGDDEGGCDDRCPICNAVCDEHCGCDIECVKCGEEFAFEADIFRDRGISLQGGMNEDQICPNCWDETEGSKNSIEEPRVCHNKYHNPMAWGYIGGRWRPEDCDICKSCCHCGKVLKEEEILNYDKGGDNFRQRNEWEEEWSEFMTAEEMKLPTCFACNDLSKAIDGDIFACWGCYNIGFCDYECKKCGIWCDNGSGEQRACKADGCEAWCVKCNKLKEGTPDRSGGIWVCKTCEK